MWRSEVKLHAEKLIHGLSFGLSETGPRASRIGIDLVHVPRIQESLREFGERFQSKLFTDAEVAYANESPAHRNERFAARFAAKEAAIKALSLSEAGVDWKDIEVVRRDDGSCELALQGKAREAADALRIHRVLVCLSHDGEYAAAMVAAMSDT
ncbi:holo-ACP synthase [Ramlibacter humi]|uniref:holo-ACP synthase n=1 Tax=Ramlibacter humi TaxID=2530451 RepID=UPI001431EA60|nr:holo-ACP synthase [Ramlibacter humi]